MLNTLLVSVFMLVNSTLPIDTVVLQGVDVVASIKIESDDDCVPVSTTNLGRVQIEHRHISSLKDITAIAPNFYIPDYGSRMTSSIYVRGFGSRIDQPVVGMNVDEIPVLNKNNFDFDFFDISKVQVLRGSQSTLFGRNTVGGAINISTLSPMVFQGKRLMAEYGNGNTFRVKASHYESESRNFGWSASVQYGHTDGFFRNTFNGKKCDGGDNVSMRLRLQYIPTDRWSVDNSFSMGYVDEGGYAYAAYDMENGTLAPIAYNDPSTYRRFNIMDGLVVKRFFDNFTLSSVTGYSFTNDRMRMDNDFLPLEYFSLGQYQKEHSFTQEFVAKSTDEKALNWLAGVFAFYKHLNLDAPVLFKQYGINELILKNANEHFFHLAGPDYHLEFRDETLPIEDKFKIPTYGVAFYSQLGYRLGNWSVSAGLRVDYEHASMDYNSSANVRYKYRRSETEYKNLYSVFKGSYSHDALELLPRFAITYNGTKGNLYATVCKGFKAGGFNTQLFSDILQKKLTDDLMNNTNDADASSTVYHPETCWNYELGMHLSPLNNDNLKISASFFFIDCRNQQLTVFPKGMSTGRMMSNAGKSHSYGCEASVAYTFGRVTADMSFGYAHATFKEYQSGSSDYSGNYLPFAPRETISANIVYRIPVSASFARLLVLNVGWNGIGKIYWNEENSLSQSFYDLWTASLVWEKGVWGASVWGKNILDKEYNTFYFKSIGNNFFAQGKPLQMGLSLYLNL